MLCKLRTLCIFLVMVLFAPLMAQADDFFYPNPTDGYRYTPYQFAPINSPDGSSFFVGSVGGWALNSGGFVLKVGPPPGRAQVYNKLFSLTGLEGFVFTSGVVADGIIYVSCYHRTVTTRYSEIYAIVDDATTAPVRIYQSESDEYINKLIYSDGLLHATGRINGAGQGLQILHLQLATDGSQITRTMHGGNWDDTGYDIIALQNSAYAGFIAIAGYIRLSSYDTDGYVIIIDPSNPGTPIRTINSWYQLVGNQEEFWTIKEDRDVNNNYIGFVCGGTFHRYSYFVRMDYQGNKLVNLPLEHTGDDECITDIALLNDDGGNQGYVAVGVKSVSARSSIGVYVLDTDGNFIEPFFEIGTADNNESPRAIISRGYDQGTF
ncbi:hypothetical protein KAJ89_05295, partial [Candidatus Parcubacteria bacterium]|nr:hypothetical protein [Candidatus Parcubacteria bacterium]